MKKVDHYEICEAAPTQTQRPPYKAQLHIDILAKDGTKIPHAAPTHFCTSYTEAARWADKIINAMRSLDFSLQKMVSYNFALVVTNNQ